MYVAFFAVFAVTAAAAVRAPREDRLTLAALFAILPLTLVLGWLRDLFAFSTPTVLTGALVMALPYLTLRALADVAEVRPIALRSALAGLVASILLLAAAPEPIPAALVVPLVIYFFAVEAYAAWVTVRAASRASGVTRRRMVAVATATLALGLALLSVPLVTLAPSLAAAPQLLALIAGLAYYVGFATPAALRHAWQAPGLRSFLGVAGAAARMRDTQDALASLARGCAVATGATGSAVALRTSAGHRFQVVTDHGAAYEAAPEDTVGARALERGRAVAEKPRPGAPWSRGMGVVLAAPVVAGEDRLGFVSVFGPRASLFVDDDLELLQLLADQAAVVLQQRRLYEEVRTVNEELERRLHELNAVNSELGAFAYSVSHDLRAPLRSLDGFSAALLQRYEGVLDETGRRYLGFLRESSQEMAQLIDDLLRLSLVTRSQMRAEDLDLSGMAAAIGERLRQDAPGRAARFDVQPGLRAAGDSALVRAALENLLANAWKFTSKRPLADISFGRVDGAGTDTFFVRDNGAGFDMRYANKLFGAFQRLHAKEDFPGTGIGLATVQRVVRRHGGDVWAEAAPDAGATFFFTLGGGEQAAPEDRLEREAVA